MKTLLKILTAAALFNLCFCLEDSGEDCSETNGKLSVVIKNSVKEVLAETGLIESGLFGGEQPQCRVSTIIHHNYSIKLDNA